jgi:hypothetical protein
MARGISIHIGLNQVDPDQYDGWSGQLVGCINDANAMKKIADDGGFSSQLILNEQATVANVVQAISTTARQLDTGDILLLTYSGHGGQVPDANAAEGDDGLDETWVLYDKMLLDDQLYVLWSQFKPGVRIFVLSDSCHSGTILRQLCMNDVAKSGARGYNPGTSYMVREKAIPKGPQAKHYARFKDDYTVGQFMTGNERTLDVKASVMLISGCQDNQTSADGDANGLFTENLLKVWNKGAFNGSYKQFHQAILDQMPPTQTPNFFQVGIEDAAFEAQRPFAISADSAASSTSATTSEETGTETTPTSTTTPKHPEVNGPGTLDRDNDGSPTFTVDTAGAPYYIFEITTDSSLFANINGRDSSNFYGSYSDNSVPNRLTESSFTLPDAAWESLKAADTLYYRIGTTTSRTGWDNYVASTPDDLAANAKSISITGARAAVERRTFAAA